MTEQEMCKAICKAASDKKARDIVTMDMQGLMISPDYFVICSANTATQVRAIADNIEEELAKDGVAFSHKEGYRDGYEKGRAEGYDDGRRYEAITHHNEEEIKRQLKL